MRRVRVSTLAGVCAVALLAGDGAAQDRPLDESLRALNARLGEHAFEEDGQRTHTQIAFRGDRMIVEVTNVRGATRVINVYDAALADVDPQRIRVRGMGSHIEISVPARGDIAATMRCENPGSNTLEWSLPNASALQVQLAPDCAVSDEVRAELERLIRQAQGR